MFHHINVAEWRWLIILSTLVMALTCLPYIIVFFATPAGWQFAWLLPNVTDAHTYLSKMRQGYEGLWQFHLTYTAEPHDGAYILLYYLALGHLARLLHLPLVLLFHVARVVAGWGLLLTLYSFIAHITTDLRERRLAFILLITSSGFGWFITIIGGQRAPIDLWLPEAFIPYTLYINPHFPLATMLMILLLQNIVWPRHLPIPSEGTNRSRNASALRFSRWAKLKHCTPTNLIYGLTPYIWVAFLAIMLVLVQPFAMLTSWIILVVFGGWLSWQERSIPYRHIALTGLTMLVALPIIMYDYQVTQTNPIMAGWAAQNITTAPPLSDILLGYGLLTIFAIVGSSLIIRQTPRVSAEWLLVLWLGSVLVAIYLPFALQRRLIHGLHIPIAILATFALRRGWPTLKSRWRNRLIMAVVTIGLLGTLFVYSIPFATALQSPDKADIATFFFLRDDEVIALAWLNEHVTSDEVVLAAPRLGMFIPSQTRAKTYYGHLYETIQADQKRDMVKAFYRGELATIPPYVDFILYGPDERALGQPPILKTLPLVFATETVKIYQVH